MATVHTLSRAASQGGAGVAIRGLGVAFGANRVIDGLDLAIGGGQFVSIVGRSGCGKSTLLRAITGLETPDRGGIETDRQRTRVVFQEPRLLPWSDVRANVEVGAAGSAAERREQADEALALVGCSRRRPSGRRDCRAVRSSAWRWRAPWSAGRGCCCWTNRSARSTR